VGEGGVRWKRWEKRKGEKGGGGGGLAVSDLLPHFYKWGFLLQRDLQSLHRRKFGVIRPYDAYASSIIIPQFISTLQEGGDFLWWFGKRLGGGLNENNLQEIIHFSTVVEHFSAKRVFTETRLKYLLWWTLSILLMSWRRGRCWGL
jgi:hypothetical protein